MAKKPSRPNKKNGRSKGSPSRARPKSNPPRRSGGRVLSRTARDWLYLLSNPCNSPLSKPCYGFGDSGYLIRTTDTFNLNAAGKAGVVYTAGLACSVDFYFGYTPNRYSATSGAVACCSIPGINGTATEGGINPSNFVLSSTVGTYRPVAACAKFIPTGTIGARSGVIARGYTSGANVTAGQTVNYGNVLNQALSQETTGTVSHEVVWLPIINDSFFENATVASANFAGGTCWLVGKGVDATVTTAGTGTAATINVNGYMQVTTVFEWTPSTGSSTQVPLNPVPAEETSDVLSVITNIADFVLRGPTVTGGIRLLNTAFNTNSPQNRMPLLGS